MTDPVFFTPSRRFTVGEIAAITGASLVDHQHSDIEILSIAASDNGEAGLLIYVDGKKHTANIDSTRASAVLCRGDVGDHVPAGVAVLVSEHPQRAFATIARLLFPSSVNPTSMTGETGVSSMAHVAQDATIEAGAIVEAGAVICSGVAIGAGSVIAPGAVIGAHCTIGRNCYVGTNASIGFAMIGDRVQIHAGVRIGEDGFGYVSGPKGLDKIPQIGRVIIQDDVEIGANTTIDRGAMGDTTIGEGTKIDNLVQIAHNVQIGRCCVIAGQCGISGSVRIGDYAALGGGVGVADHLEIGNGAMVAAGSGIMHNVPAGEKWFGSPAQPRRQQMRELVMLRELSGARGKKGKANG